MLINCDECGKEFNKSTGEYNRSVRLKRGHFCNTKCSAAFGNRKIPRGNTHQFQKHVQSQLNDLSPFRFFTNHTKRRNDERGRPKGRRGPKREFNITPRYLLTVWESQNGCCPLTGWKLALPYSSAGQFDGPAIRRASLDRIDNDLGYIEGNVRFVAQIANVARNKYSDDDVITFCEAVVHFNLGDIMSSNSTAKSIAMEDEAKRKKLAGAKLSAQTSASARTAGAGAKLSAQTSASARTAGAGAKVQ